MLNKEERYKAAHDAHKHYDNLSVAVVTGIITLASASMILTKTNTSHAPVWFIYMSTAIVILVLFQMYKSFSYSAGIARGVAEDIESNSDSTAAISTAYRLKDKNNPYASSPGRIYKSILFLTTMVTICFIGLAVWSFI